MPDRTKEGLYTSIQTLRELPHNELVVKEPVIRMLLEKFDNGTISDNELAFLAGALEG